MELSNVERALPPRPLAPGASLAASEKLPPPRKLPDLEGVINAIDPQLQALAQRMALNVPTGQGGGQPAASTAQDAKPQREPLSQMLMAQWQSVWTASARVVALASGVGRDHHPTHTQEVQQAQVQHRNLVPADVPGTQAQARLTYIPGKVKKIDEA